MKEHLRFLKISLADKKMRMSLVATLITIVGLLLVSFESKELSQEKKNSETSSSTDEMIPPGFVMVPLDLQNKEALRSLVGAFAVVDLFTVSPDGQKKGVRVGSRLKLLRSPLDPEQFSALVEEDQAALLFSHSGPLFAVVQSRQARGSSFLKIPIQNSRIHTY